MLSLSLNLTHNTLIKIITNVWLTRIMKTLIKVDMIHSAPMTIISVNIDEKVLENFDDKRGLIGRSVIITRLMDKFAKGEVKIE